MLRRFASSSNAGTHASERINSPPFWTSRPLIWGVKQVASSFFLSLLGVVLCVAGMGAQSSRPPLVLSPRACRSVTFPHPDRSRLHPMSSAPTSLMRACMLLAPWLATMTYACPHCIIRASVAGMAIESPKVNVMRRIRRQCRPQSTPRQPPRYRRRHHDAPTCSYSRTTPGARPTP